MPLAGDRASEGQCAKTVSCAQETELSPLGPVAWAHSVDILWVLLIILALNLMPGVKDVQSRAPATFECQSCLGIEQMSGKS